MQQNDSNNFYYNAFNMLHDLKQTHTLNAIQFNKLMLNCQLMLPWPKCIFIADVSIYTVLALHRRNNYASTTHYVTIECFKPTLNVIQRKYCGERDIRTDKSTKFFM